MKPSFTTHLYEATISEGIGIGSTVVTVSATDPEPGNNGLVHYSIFQFNKKSRDTDWFTIDSETGVITTKRFFDHETQSEFKFLVEAADGGVPSLSSTSTVVVMVTDLNDNAPVFDQLTYHCTVTDKIARGQLITKVSAVDPDSTGATDLRYAIIGGNDKQTFEMDEKKGIISLSDQRIPNLYLAYELNVSVSDGVFTNFARVSLKIQNSNNHAPKFDHMIYPAEFPENYGEDMMVTQVSATDDDEGTYGMITYTIPSEEMKKYFRVDADSGKTFCCFFSFTLLWVVTAYKILFHRLRTNKNQVLFITRHFTVVIY